MPVSGRRIGLLGGSFNPAHAGHRAISLEAIAKLGLDEIWWLVSPQNPLKEASELADYAMRVTLARKAASHPAIRVSDLEARLGTRYTIHTLRALRLRFPEHAFVWLMGADNLAGFHRWKEWEALAAENAIAVFDRKPYTHAALRSRAALRLAGRRLNKGESAKLAPGRWIYVFGRLNPLSASGIRKNLGDKAFLGA